MSARRWGWWLFVVIALGLVFHPLLFSRAIAAPVFQAEGRNGQPAALRLLDAPCRDEKVLTHIALRAKPELAAKFKAAVLSWGGALYASCWIEMDKVVYSIDEEGSFFQPVPRALFRDDSV